MNLLLFTPEERRPDGTVAVSGRRLQHLREVHGKKPGERVRAGELGGLMGDAAIVALSEDEALLRPSPHTSPPGKLPLILVVALPRPKMLRRVLRTAAEQGVAEIRLIHSYRVEKSYWQTPALKEATVREYLLQFQLQYLVQGHQLHLPHDLDLFPHLALVRFVQYCGAVRP